MSELVLDHIGVIVRDLEAGWDAFTRLGFALTPRSLHSGATRPGGPVEPWGSGNHCAMLSEGYLEILGIVDPSRYTSAHALLKRYEGTHTLALGTADVKRAVAEIGARGGRIDPPRILERMASYGENGAEQRRAAFLNAYVDTGQHPEARFLVIQHVTPEVLWQPHLMVHPNGAKSLDAVWICAEDMRAAIDSVSMLTGVTPLTRAHGQATFPLARGRIEVVAADALDSFAPGIVPPVTPFVAGFDVGVADLAATVTLLARNGLAVERSGDALAFVRPELACGACVRFVQTAERAR